MAAQNSAYSSATCGGLVWWDSRPRCSGVKQKVTVTSNSRAQPSAGQTGRSAPSRKESAKESQLAVVVVVEPLAEESRACAATASLASPIVSESALPSSFNRPPGRRSLPERRGYLRWDLSSDRPCPSSSQWNGVTSKTAAGSCGSNPRKTRAPGPLISLFRRSDARSLRCARRRR